jgi:hypothetical protein
MPSFRSPPPHPEALSIEKRIGELNRFKQRAGVPQSFRMPDHQIAVLDQAVGKFINDPLQRFMAEINGHVPANQQLQVPHFGLRIRVRDQVVIFERDHLFNGIGEFKPVAALFEIAFEKSVGHQMHRALAVNPFFRERQRLPVDFGGRDVAAKTGTTNNVKDGWVIGYTDKLVVGGWIGKNDNTTFGDVNASLSIVPLWNQIFNKLLQKYPAGQLNKDYSGIPELDGVKCTADGAAMDVIYTVMQAGLFTHITPNDPQIKNWFYQSTSPYCGVAPALDPNATGTPTTGVTGEGVTVTTPDMSVPQPITNQTGTGLQPAVPQN